ncbi:uncharacterized protein ACLA_070840 [Aspergillus clavatus NRRL 1]|uniref:Uncharacterized protein n=1 Tax=Aspergillus clavatus (strain ATCC 1007 / CBS 513.65 / DSM 816 / NCTC 3887 / NRRL 1 / QM 1276 / 107) TaxID=344612 RepID=A1C6N0_ASPCL|nr:uncharacterized protein ACLA_070840 [Aspergillus clavatus NRRL 1]EAW14051.1 conserved hypothetical protein [Aspergillus clavatus NRRL 1]
MASLWVLGVFYIVWLIRDLFWLPFGPSGTDSFTGDAAKDFFAHYTGRQECGFSSVDVYNPPEGKAYCRTRDSLLSAMSNGGRHGFDAAYTSQGCVYRWYTSSQICDILQRFDGIVFIGDESLAGAYAGFNILLRENLPSGSLRDWEMSNEYITQCKCDSQLNNPSCWPKRIRSSEEVFSQSDKSTSRSSYACSKHVPHAFVQVVDSPSSMSSREKVQKLLSLADGQKKPVPVIHSVSLSASFSLPIAKNSMDEWLALAKTTNRNTPFLWIGPTAAGHQRPTTANNIPANSAVWQYALDTTGAARSRGMDVLGMYNATLQAASWDGKHYGEKVALMQAMMVTSYTPQRLP